MSEHRDPIVNLAEKRPGHLAAVILRQNRGRLAEHRRPDKQAAAAKDYVRARTFLREFRWNLTTFLALLVYIILLATLAYLTKGPAARDELILASVSAGVAIIAVAVAFRRRGQAQRLVERANLAAEARKAAVLSRTQDLEPSS